MAKKKKKKIKANAIKVGNWSNPSNSSSSKKSAAAKQSHYKNGEVLTCVWDVWISGKKLDWDKKNLIQSIEIKETVDGSDTATITISDPDYEYVNDNIYIEANKIKIQMGWSSYKTRIKFEGYISHVDMSFPSDGVPKLTLTCMDKTYRMDKKTKSKTYKKKTTAQVVKKICKNYGFKCVVQKGYKFKKQDTITQSNQTDIAFIQQLAQNEVYPFTARLVGNTFYYQKKGKIADSAKYTLRYDDYPFDIISFEPKINKVSKDINSGKTKIKTKKAKATKVTEINKGKAKVSGKSKTTGTTAKKSGGSSTSAKKKGRNTTTSASKSSSSSGKNFAYDKNKKTWKET